MSSKKRTPIFPIPEPHHFSDYGFDPKIDYFQVLEEVSRNRGRDVKSIDALQFKLQKPFSKDGNSCKKTKKSTTKNRWWKNALLFFRRKWVAIHCSSDEIQENGGVDAHCGRALQVSLSCPLYITESRSGSNTPYRTSTRKPYSGPLAGILRPPVKGKELFPYISLRELNMDHHRRTSTSAMPIYLVT